MSGWARLLFVLGLAVIGWSLARARAAVTATAGSVPAQSGWYAALWTALPPLAFLGVWAWVAPALVTDTVLASPAAATLPAAGFARATVLASARLATAAGSLAHAYALAQARCDWLATAAAALLAVAGFLYAQGRLTPGFEARARLERAVHGAMLAASLVAIVATAGIVVALIWESGRFFALVSPADFLLGRHWNPQAIAPEHPGASLGALPVFWGTFLIGAVIAMAVAAPLGLGSAVFLTQYATPVTRRRLKPALELLAGVPTVVYGWLAALTIAPAVRDLGLRLGIADASAESALAAGLVMGVMIIPYVSSIADDSLAALPRSLRDGSLALGATASETIRRVLLPAALPGVAGGLTLAVSRAVGETMIVVMAASGLATLSANPFRPATTVTRQIVDLLTGEAAFDSAKTLAAFALGLTLFAITFLLNLVALGIVARYRAGHE